MTASLDRAVEAVCESQWSCWEALSEAFKASMRRQVRSDLLAALPHLGVDREALRGLADGLRKPSPYRHSCCEEVAAEIADDLITIINAKQE
jgi:hypothetical protein